MIIDRQGNSFNIQYDGYTRRLILSINLVWFWDSRFEDGVDTDIEDIVRPSSSKMVKLMEAIYKPL